MTSPGHAGRVPQGRRKPVTADSYLRRLSSMGPDKVLKQRMEKLKQRPRNATAARSKIGVNDGIDASDAQICGAGTVEGQPAEPDEDCPDSH